MISLNCVGPKQPTMKLNLLFTGIVAMVFASCSTTIERNATAFGGGWGMNSSKESYKSKPSEEKKETPRNSAQTGKKSTQLIISNSQRNEVIPEKQLKAEDLFKNQGFKNLNFVQKSIAKKALKKIKKKQVESKKNAPHLSVTSNATQGSGIPLSSDEQIIAILLCFFLGGLGIHRFYLGYTTVGVIQLLTAGGCGVWVIIDFIRLIIGDLGRAGGSASNGGSKSDNFGPMG